MNTYQDDYSQVIWGDAREVLKSFSEHSVDMSMTSPPFYGLRKYEGEPAIWDDHNECEHEWGEYESGLLHENRNGLNSYTAEVNPDIHGYQKHKDGFCLKCKSWRGQLGLEPDPDLYISHLCDIFDLVKRVLKPAGSLWVNISDSYAGSNNGSNDYRGSGSSISANSAKYQGQKTGRLNVPPKSLIRIPERFTLEMLRRGWINRQTVIWWKRSCMPISATDRFTPDFEYLYHFTLKQKFFFEQQFEPHLRDWTNCGGTLSSSKTRQGGTGWATKAGRNDDNRQGDPIPNPQGRNLRCVWDIPAEQLSLQVCKNCMKVYDREFYERLNIANNKRICRECGSTEWVSHFASYPRELCRIPILATCPEFICDKCGKPRKKIYEIKRPDNYDASVIDEKYSSNALKASGGQVRGTSRPLSKIFEDSLNSERILTGYSDCGCPEPKSFHPGTVLDPFCGSGTTLVKAKELGMKSIGIDLSSHYCTMSAYRLRQVEGVQKELV